MYFCSEDSRILMWPRTGVVLLKGNKPFRRARLRVCVELLAINAASDNRKEGSLSMLSTTDACREAIFASAW